MNHTDLVARIKADCIARGIIPVPQTTNEHSFEITCRVAYELRGDGAMLIVKVPPQNGADIHGVRFAHDAIAFPTGWIDCLRSAGPPANENAPAWNPTNRSVASLVSPFDLDAGTVVVPPTPPPPVDPPPPNPELSGNLVAEIAGLRADLRELMDVLQLDQSVYLGGLEQIKSTTAALVAGLTQLGGVLGGIEGRQRAGVSGTVFGTRITLKPPA